jgi:protein PET117
MEKQRIRLERQADFAMQKALEEEYRKIQKVSPSIDSQISSAGQSNLDQGT